MSEKFLNRQDVPFSEKVWEKIDEAVVAAAASQLSGRRLIKIQGPYGLSMKALHSSDIIVNEEIVEGAAMTSSCTTPLAMIQSRFTLPVRDIAVFEQSGQPIDLDNAAKAAIICAKQEDKLIFNGSEALKLKGLLNIEGCQSLKLKQWSDIGAAAEDILQAITLLDNNGFHGPYALGLSIGLYNFLFRRYSQGSTEYEHIKQFVTDGIIKVPAIPSGGILLCTCGPFANIILGQDITTGFIGPADNEYEFIVFESAALRLTQPQAVCVLKVE